MNWGSFDSITLDQSNEPTSNANEVKQYETTSTTTTLLSTTTSSYYRNIYRTSSNPMPLYTRGARPEPPTEALVTLAEVDSTHIYEHTYTQPPERFEEVNFNAIDNDVELGTKVQRTTVIENSMELFENEKPQAEILLTESFQPAVESMDNQMQIVIPEGVQSLTGKRHSLNSNLL